MGFADRDCCRGLRARAGLAEVSAPSLFDPPVNPVPEHRVRALAHTMAGMRWPGRGSFEKLKKGQQEAAVRAARAALERLAAEPDE